MPRAYDPSLPGGGLPITHSPLNRLQHNVIPNPTDLLALLDLVMEGFFDSIEDYLFPAIESITGIDLGAFLPLLHAIDLDFSSPEAFLQSLVTSIAALPAALVELLVGLIQMLKDSPEMFADLISNAVGLLISLPSLIIELATALVESGAGILGIKSPLDALNLFNLVPTDLLSHIPMSNIGSAVTNLLTDPNFLDPNTFSADGIWTHVPGGGYNGTGAAQTVADGTTRELLGNLIPVSEGQVLPISVRAKWSGLAGTGLPIALGVTGYQPGGATVQARVAEHNTTPPTTDWVTLSGNYTVPANVTSLRTRLIVAAPATAGTVSFSTVSATKVGPMLQRLIAGTDVGEFLPDDIENLFSGIITNALELLNKAKLADFNDLVSTIAGDVGDTIEDAGERLATFLDQFSPLNADKINTGNVADQFVPGIGTIIDNIVTRMLGITGSGFTHTQATDALQHNTFALIEAASRISVLENTFTGGVSDGDDFERTSSTSLGPEWLTSYTGSGGVWATPNGHDATFAASGISDRGFLCIRNNPAVPRSTTDYQRVVSVLSSRPTEFFGYAGYNDIWLRISDDTTSLANITGIRIRFGGTGGCSIDRFVSGIGTTLNSVAGLTTPGPGSAIIGLAGAPGLARYFAAYIGSYKIAEITEVGVASGLGGAFRRWGHGGLARGHLLPLPGQQIPGGCHQWTAMDQVAS